ncbi:MAG: hypothetical protein HY564_03455 [Candidatus Jacksonbacteria bacterium]|nr:hypothetical protein [Candidatus Jacksonbacteria bacterium]
MESIWRTIKVQYANFEEERTRALDVSGEVLRGSKRNIHLLVHERLSNVPDKLRELKNKVLALLKMVKQNPLLHHVSAIDDGLEEYVEFVMIVSFLEGNPKMAASFVKTIESEALIGGIADATGELVRIAMTKMNDKEGEKIRDYIVSVYHHLLDLPISRNGKLRSKTHDVHRNLLKIEEILFDIKLRRLEQGT